MNARSITEFQDNIDKMLSVRKKELTTIKFMNNLLKREHEKKVYYRLVIPLIYSHYEGFVKSSSILYLQLVLNISHPLNNLPDNIFALSIRDAIYSCSKSKKCSLHVDLIKTITNRSGKPLFSPEHIIDTQSNLSSTVLAEIMFSCGIIYSTYWEKKSFFIDNILLKNRNLIAHGELIDIDEITVMDIHKNVIDIMEAYKVELENVI